MRICWFAGTEFGAFFTIDGGAHWVQLKGGLPTICGARYGGAGAGGGSGDCDVWARVYVLDDISALRQMKAESVEQLAATFAVKDALLISSGIRWRAEEGISGGRVLYGGESCVWCGVHGLSYGEAEDEKGESGRKRRKMRRRKIRRCLILE